MQDSKNGEMDQVVGLPIKRNRPASPAPALRSDEEVVGLPIKRNRSMSSAPALSSDEEVVGIPIKRRRPAL